MYIFTYTYAYIHIHTHTNAEMYSTLIIYYRLEHQWFHILDESLTELSSELVKAKIIPFTESDNLHINLYIRFLFTAEQVGTLININQSIKNELQYAKHASQRLEMKTQQLPTSFNIWTCTKNGKFWM